MYFISIPIIVGIILGIYVTSNLVSDSINDQSLLTNTQLMKNGSPEMGLANAPISIVEAQEKALAIKLIQFEEVLDQMIAEATPHVLCSYLYELASLYMSFYEACPVLKEGVEPATKESRLMLCNLVAKTLAKGLDLLGIEVMEQM